MLGGGRKRPEDRLISIKKLSDETCFTVDDIKNTLDRSLSFTHILTLAFYERESVGGVHTHTHSHFLRARALSFPVSLSLLYFVRTPFPSFSLCSCMLARSLILCMVCFVYPLCAALCAVLLSMLQIPVDYVREMGRSLRQIVCMTPHPPKKSLPHTHGHSRGRAVPQRKDSEGSRGTYGGRRHGRGE